MKIKCCSCKYARLDDTQRETVLVKGKSGMEKKEWVGVECGNRYSEYFKSLLNVMPNGNILWRVTWNGCEHGERKVK